FQPLFHQRQGEARPVNRDVKVAKDVRKRADMILMTVGENDCANFRAVLLQIGNVRNDKVNSKKLRFREHHAGIDDDDVVAKSQHQHVHTEFDLATTSSSSMPA